MEQLKSKWIFPIEYPAYQNGNKLISQDVSDLMETFPFIRKPSFHILSRNPYSWSYAEHADIKALWYDNMGTLLRNSLLTSKILCRSSVLCLTLHYFLCVKVRANFKL